ncbi:hypothetical protein HZH68_014983 [Vespula germanica]|uniref:Uncharacterized protein n=1 Tax=Vespula germanica TaxID=30212 RepID=A0A834MTJ3_VESGE|nr:hypothetical protein HZH68_014983 [Vespula germanica]
MCRISLQEIVTIVICFILQIKVSEVIENLRSWRHQRGDNELSCKTKYLVVIAKLLIDETFLTKRKYHLGGIIEQMSIFVLSIYSKEDKSGICTDNAKQYHSVEEIISSSCMQLNQSIVEFVATDDCMNTINNLEAQNKLLKRTIVFWKKAVVLYQYMCLMDAMNFLKQSGLYHFLTVFQRFINSIFRDLMLKNIVLTYLGDLIVLSQDEKEGLYNLCIVLTTARVETELYTDAYSYTFAMIMQKDLIDQLFRNQSIVETEKLQIQHQSTPIDKLKSDNLSPIRIKPLELSNDCRFNFRWAFTNVGLNTSGHSVGRLPVDIFLQCRD